LIITIKAGRSDRASETLKAADGVAKTIVLELVQCRHAKSLQSQGTKSSVSYFVFFYNASLSKAG